jgi:hypothetical protein
MPKVTRDVRNRTTALKRQPNAALDQLQWVLPRSWHPGRLSLPADETTDQSPRQNRPGSLCLYMCAGAANRPRTCSGRQRRTHLNRQRRQLLHRGAVDRQPASSALVAARAATATLRQRYGLRRCGRRYLHRRRRAAPSLLQTRPQTDSAIGGRATIDRAMRTSTWAAPEGIAARKQRG